MTVETLALKLKRRFGLSDSQLRAMGVWGHICTWSELKKLILAIARKRSGLTQSFINELLSIGFTRADLNSMGLMKEAQPVQRSLPRSFYASLSEQLARMDALEKDDDDYELEF